MFSFGRFRHGHTIKLINNFYSQLVANGMAEAFAMADKANVDRQVLYDVMAAGPGRSGLMDFVKAYAVEGDDSNMAFSVKNARKDVGYYVAMTESLGVESMMAQGAKQALGMAMTEGRGEDFVPRQVDFFTKLFDA